MKNSEELQVSALKLLAKRELYKRNAKYRENFKEFVLHFFEIELGRQFVWNWHHEEIFNALEDLWNDPEQEILIVNIHPNSGKTELITKLYAVWKMGNIKDFWVMGIGYSADLMKDFSTEAREYVESKTYKSIFNAELDEAQRAKEYWRTQDKGRYYAVGVGGTITGKRADLMIIDDPVNPKEVNSMTQLKKTVDWFKRTVRSRRRVRYNSEGELISRGKIVIVMQRLHEYDLCGVLLDEGKDKLERGVYKHLCIPAIAKENDEHRKIGEAMFPQFFPVSFLEEERDSMSDEKDIHHFSAQYQQSPLDMANASFKRDYFQYIDAESLSRIKLVSGCIGVDPASSQKDSADYRAISVIGRDSMGIYYLLDAVYGRWSPTEFQNKIFEIQNVYKYPVFIETNHGGGFLTDSIAMKQKAEQNYFRCEGIINSGNKIERILNTLEPLYKNFRIFHSEHLKRSEMEDQLEFFPKAKHDDLPDSMEIAIKNIESVKSGAFKSNVSQYINR